MSTVTKPLRFLVTAGPTREPIDPVRFISNYSTGAMGYAVAKAAKKKGHRVVLIAGPSDLMPPKNVGLVKIVTAQDMFKVVKKHAEDADCVIMVAAVSDFRPAAYSLNKIKRSSSKKSIRLQKNPDILYWLGKRKTDKILVGFCMETEKLINNAKKKMIAKNLDIVVANRIDKKASVFGASRTNVIILGPEKRMLKLDDVSKENIASILLDKIDKLWYKRTQNSSPFAKASGDSSPKPWRRRTKRKTQN